MENYLNLNYSLPSIIDYNQIFFDEKCCLEYLFKKEFFPQTIVCPRCQRVMKLNKDLKIFGCRDKECQKSVSVRKDTIFSSKTLECCTVLLLGYFWLNKTGTSSAITMSGCSPNTVLTEKKLSKIKHLFA